MIKNLITNSSQGSDLLLKQNRRCFAAQSCIYGEKTLSICISFSGLDISKGGLDFPGMMGFHSSLQLKHNYLKRESLK